MKKQKNARHRTVETQMDRASATPASEGMKSMEALLGSPIPETARLGIPEIHEKDASAASTTARLKPTLAMSRPKSKGRQAVLETQPNDAASTPANGFLKPSDPMPGSISNARQKMSETHRGRASAASPASDQLKPTLPMPDSPSKKGRQNSSETRNAFATLTPASSFLKPSKLVPGSLLSSTIEAIRAHHRERRFAMGIQQVLDRKLESYIRINKTEWHVGDDEATREKANKEVAAKIKAARKGEGDPAIIKVVRMTDDARGPADAERARHEKEMTALAKQLPVASWVESVSGFGLLGLATIIAETGDLSNYSNVAKVWKRLGFAPYKGRAGSSWKRPSWHKGDAALTADEWIENPFSGRRYSLIHVISVWLLNKQWIGAAKTDDGVGKPNGVYGDVYAKRRVHTAVTHPDWTKKHAQMDALRIMMKKVLKDLWLEWNQVERKTVGRHQWCEVQVRGATTETPAGFVLKPNEAMPGSPIQNVRHPALETQSGLANETPATPALKPKVAMPGSPLPAV